MRGTWILRAMALAAITCLAWPPSRVVGRTKRRWHGWPQGDADGSRVRRHAGLSAAAVGQISDDAVSGSEISGSRKHSFVLEQIRKTEPSPTGRRCSRSLACKRRSSEYRRDPGDRFVERCLLKACANDNVGQHISARDAQVRSMPCLRNTPNGRKPSATATASAKSR